MSDRLISDVHLHLCFARSWSIALRAGVTDRLSDYYNTEFSNKAANINRK